MNRQQRRAARAEEARKPVIPNLISNQWDSYREEVVPAEAPPEQVTECRRAFFAGAHALLYTVMRVMDSGEEPTDRDMAQMDAIDKELRDFAARVGTGRF